MSLLLVFQNVHFIQLAALKYANLTYLQSQFCEDFHDCMNVLSFILFFFNFTVLSLYGYFQSVCLIYYSGEWLIDSSLYYPVFLCYQKYRITDNFSPLNAYHIFSNPNKMYAVWLLDFFCIIMQTNSYRFSTQLKLPCTF